MNQLLGQQTQANRNDQPHAINVNVVANLKQGNLNFQLSIDPEIPFNVFLIGIKEQIFAQRMQAQYEETIEYQLGNGSNLQQKDARTLSTLGFTNNCTLYVRLKLKVGVGYQKQNIISYSYNLLYFFMYMSIIYIIIKYYQIFYVNHIH